MWFAPLFPNVETALGVIRSGVHSSARACRAGCADGATIPKARGDSSQIDLSCRGEPEQLTRYIRRAVSDPSRSAIRLATACRIDPTLRGLVQRSRTPTWYTFGTP
jgi:hypothetical protein